jgi:pimeloyl-ACP methyl ester carboxylesterase
MLQGDEDVRSPVDVARELAAAIPDSTLRILPRVGHQSNLEAPEAFAEAVLTFVRDVDA